ncbi:hypothetical protein [Hydrotalea sp.]|nr:hypothetical protein [Hydrotalea sp.]
MYTWGGTNVMIRPGPTKTTSLPGLGKMRKVEERILSSTQANKYC